MIIEIYNPITINCYEHYLISNKGNVKNSITNNILKLHIKMGYYYINLGLKDKKDKDFRVHRLVALAFILNDDPINKTFVNHINGNKLDNIISNLEWITPKGNVEHALNTGLLKPFERKVCKYDLEENLLETYNSIKEASEKNNIDSAGIVKVCKKYRQTAGDFKWKYQQITEREEVIDINDTMKSIVDFPNYKITSDGKVYSASHKKFLKSRLRIDGYEDIQVSNNKIKKTFLVHRLVATHYIPKIEGFEHKDSINHKNGNKLDNRMENLEWTTNSENVKHYHYELKNKKNVEV